MKITKIEVPDTEKQNFQTAWDELHCGAIHSATARELIYYFGNRIGARSTKDELRAFFGLDANAGATVLASQINALGSPFLHAFQKHMARVYPKVPYQSGYLLARYGLDVTSTKALVWR